MDVETSQCAILAALHRKFITGCHVLHHNNILDAYGHLSVRHPFNPHVFIMSRSMAPGTVSSPSDLIEYHVLNAEPLDPTRPQQGFAERHIHAAVYKRHAHVHAVIHSHAESVIPYSITGIPLQPCYHMAGFLGAGLQGFPEVYDAAHHWAADDIPDMLVRNARLGEPLAACFDAGAVVALMRGHGMTVVGSSIESVVFRAVYTVKNAGIQTTAMTMQTVLAVLGGRARAGAQTGLRYLDDREAQAATKMGKDTVQRPWDLWCREVEACGFYVNSA